MAKRKTPRVLVVGHATQPILRAGGRVVHAGLGDRRAKDAIEKGVVNGLLLTGGGDINPLLYAGKRHDRTYGVDNQRDAAEWDALAAADEAGIPVMGICRGAQMINVAHGGTLHQHLGDVQEAHAFHRGGDHRVRTAEGSRLAGAWRGKERWVISIHHQAVDQVAPGFVATGWGLDGTIEAIEALEGWVLGVQFHPEMNCEAPHHQRIFDRFVSAAARHAGIVGWHVPKRPDRAPRQTSGYTAYDIEKDTTWRQPVRVLHRSHPPVLTKWRCFRCGIDFDERVDHVDHMLFLHGVSIG